MISAASDLLDHSFELCEFTDDPLPLGGKLRSDHMKILYREFSVSTICKNNYVTHLNSVIPQLSV